MRGGTYMGCTPEGVIKWDPRMGTGAADEGSLPGLARGFARCTVLVGKSDPDRGEGALW